MNNSNLALYGGEQTIKHQFKRYNPIGEEEKKAAIKVIESGCLSKFLGSWSSDFYGGPYVKAFEEECKKYFNVKFAITVNSWTSGLICALGAVGIEPGDEVIVTPWTMCATATSILHWNAIPVFADIDKKTFNISPEAILEKITTKTKAIMAVDIFGQSCDLKKLKAIASENNLLLITDSAQAPGTKTSIGKTGTLSDIGGFSLNYHKHIHTGEGGIIVTNSEDFYHRACLIRNHAEAAVEGFNLKDISNMVGYNFRLGEIECAIGIEQLKKLDKIIERRRYIAAKLNQGLKDLKGLSIPKIMEGNTHSYYIYPLILDIEKLGVTRNQIQKALEAEGLEGIIAGYANIHLLPIFQRKIAYGKKGFPWNSEFSCNNINYRKGICPNAEELHEKTFLGYEMCLHQLEDDYEIDLIIATFHKVWDSLDQLKK